MPGAFFNESVLLTAEGSGGTLYTATAAEDSVMLCVSLARSVDRCYGRSHTSRTNSYSQCFDGRTCANRTAAMQRRPPPMNATALPAMETSGGGVSVCLAPLMKRCWQEMMASSPSAGWHGGALLTPTGKRGREANQPSARPRHLPPTEVERVPISTRPALG